MEINLLSSLVIRLSYSPLMNSSTKFDELEFSDTRVSEPLGIDPVWRVLNVIVDDFSGLQRTI